MIPLTLAEIAAVVDGTVHGDPTLVVTGPAYVDTRAATDGGLFVAVVGERVDGHDYATGAHAVLGARPTDAPTVVVADPVVALGRLARHVVDALAVPVLAMTGSQGKTGTKDYLAHVLGTAGRTIATAANNNNEIGVPLTVLRADTTTDYLVVEMGARGIGHIAYLCDIAPPSVAAVLNVGTAHIGEFGSREAIAAAKGELVEALDASGTAVLNADDDLTAAMSSRTRARTLTFGTTGEVSWGDVELDALGRPTVELAHDGTRRRVSLAQSGAHQVANAAAAVAMALAVGRPFDEVVGALETATSASQWRMELLERADGLLVVNDSYNANPASMTAAIDTLAAIGSHAGRRTLAVLGEMRELGADTEAGHREVGAAAAAHGIDVVVVVGGPAHGIADALAEPAVRDGWHGEVIVTAGRDDALVWLRENALSTDVVLVKASRGAALEVVAQALLDEDPTDRPTERGEVPTP